MLEEDVDPFLKGKVLYVNMPALSVGFVALVIIIVEALCTIFEIM